MAKKPEAVAVSPQKSLKQRLWDQRYLFLLLAPALASLIVFNYGSMTGIYMAFTNFAPRGNGYLQVSFIAAGMFVGEYCTLMKYTGVTGNFIKGQTIWWLKQLIYIEDGRWQDLAWWFPLWLALSIILGAVLQAIVRFIYNRMKDHEVRKMERQENKKKISKKKESKKQENKKKTAAKEEAKAPEETKVEEKKVNYIENPLPLPKKHVSRTLDFKTDENNDGFDVEVNTNDDFDIS